MAQFIHTILSTPRVTGGVNELARKAAALRAVCLTLLCTPGRDVNLSALISRLKGLWGEASTVFDPEFRPKRAQPKSSPLYVNPVNKSLIY